MKVTVIGAGAWGTTLANLLCQNQNAVTLWGYDPAQVLEMERTGRNQLFLPGIPLARELKFQAGPGQGRGGQRVRRGGAAVKVFPRGDEPPAGF